MSEIKLVFPPLSGGRPKGVNSSGIAAFKGDPSKSLAREWAQNAIDACHKAFPIEMDFELKEYAIHELPCFDQLAESVKSCANYWKGQAQEQKFCKNVLERFAETIPVLVITDRGTTGLRGADDDKTGQWFGLVESTETSVGNDDRGGSFGIGKNAAFAASCFQTIYFSTHSIDGNFAFKGVSVLMTHLDNRGRETQADGAIGVYLEDVGKIVALRDPVKIPCHFKRTEPGLTTYIPGYKPVYKNPMFWQDELVMSLLSNFWPAIHFEKVAFRVQGIEINKDTIASLMKQYAEKYDGEKEEFTAHLYYRVFTSANSRKFSGTLKYLRDVELFAVKEAELPQMPNNVALTRQNGLIIKTENFRGLGFPFAGLFVCCNHEGNRIMRQMEPPQHNDLQPKQLDDLDGEKVLKELHDWVRDRLLEFRPKLEKEEYDLPDVAHYFPVSEEDETPLEALGQSKNENLSRSPVKREVEVKRAKQQPPKEERGGDGPDGGPGEDDGGAPDHGGKGDDTSTGGKVSTSGGKSGELKKVHCRGFSVGPGLYKLIMRTNENFSATIDLLASGDSVREPIKVIKACDQSGMCHNVKEGKVMGVKFISGQPLVLILETKEKERYALDVEVRCES